MEKHCLRNRILSRNRDIHSWESYSCAVNQQNPYILQNSGFITCLPLVHNLSQMNPVNILPPYFYKIDFNSILPHTPRFSKWSQSFSFPYQTIVWTSLRSQTCYMKSQSDPLSIHNPNNIW